MAQKRGNRAQIERVLRELQRKEIRVGVFAERVYDDGTPAAYVAAIQELGHPESGIPARPFLRPTFQQRNAENRELMARGIRAAINGRISTTAMLDQIGRANAGAVSTTISQITEPPLAPSTIAAKKGATKPLVDTGYLIQSITSEVVDV